MQSLNKQLTKNTWCWRLWGNLFVNVSVLPDLTTQLLTGGRGKDGGTRAQLNSEMWKCTRARAIMSALLLSRSLHSLVPVLLLCRLTLLHAGNEAL